MIYAFDIDNTICLTKADDYKKAKPIPERIKAINKLYDEGHTINMWTARGFVTNIDWYDFTIKQLRGWGLNFHKLYMKPYADIMVDDKALSDKAFFDES